MPHLKQKQILDFWFGEDPLKPLDKMDFWFSKQVEFDDEIRARFLDSGLMTQAESGAFDDWAKTARGALALVILLDQFPRNVYRGDPASFKNDDHARRIAEQALDRGLDQQLSPIERCFMYLPLEHSEDLDAQNRSVELFSALDREAEPEERAMIQQAIEFALRHREIIERFGRFPHRNDILNRQSTAAEHEFLKTPNSGF